MKESIYTIPISEVFEPKCGCPICSLYQTLETRWVEYITGAAMMEPDVRTETNKQGFCLKHFDMMLKLQNRLSVALILQSRLEYIGDNLCSPTQSKGFFSKPKSESHSHSESCFVCGQINREFERIGGNIASLWLRDSDFKALYAQQQYLCLPHFKILEKAAQDTLKASESKSFIEESARLTNKKLVEVKSNIDSFCNLFDYRNAGTEKPPEEVSSAIETAIEYLSGHNPTD